MPAEAKEKSTNNQQLNKLNVLNAAQTNNWTAT